MIIGDHGKRVPAERVPAPLLPFFRRKAQGFEFLLLLLLSLRKQCGGAESGGVAHGQPYLPHPLKV